MNVCVWMQVYVLHSSHAYPLLIIFPLFHFRPTLKEKLISKDKDDKMQYKQREIQMCVKNETQK